MSSVVNESSSKELFNFIHPLDNDSISNMKAKDLRMFIALLDDYYLSMRNDLGLDSSISFGVELEFEHAIRNKIEEEIRNLHFDDEWKIVNDISLIEGAEIDSPILYDKAKNWKELEEVCSVVQNYASICDKAGGHVHVGAHILDREKDTWLRLLRLWSTYENVLFRFSYGERLTARPSLSTYSPPIAELINEKWNSFQYDSLYSILFNLSIRRDRAVNFNNVCALSDEFLPRNTIEFRCPNGTLDPVIWQNNVNLFTKMLLAIKNHSYDESIVEKRHDLNSNELMKLEWYDEVYLQPSLELADLVFDNNLDKINYLKQYLKSFEVKKKEDSYPKAKVLTKEKK